MATFEYAQLDVDVLDGTLTDASGTAKDLNDYTLSAKISGGYLASDIDLTSEITVVNALEGTFTLRLDFITNELEIGSYVLTLRYVEDASPIDDARTFRRDTLKITPSEFA